jgi:hypothetical protein
MPKRKFNRFNTSGGYFSATVFSKSPKVAPLKLSHLNKNLLTLDGRDLFHAQCYTNTSNGTRGAGFVAVTTDTGNPATSDTTLAGELSGSGFARADATTKTHTNDTNSTTIEHTFTASGTVNSIVKSGTFNNASSTTLCHEATFTSASLITNDTLKVTWTLNLG